MGGRRSRPAGGEPAGGEVSVAATNNDHTANNDSHGALLAADATLWFNRLAWEQAIHRAVERRDVFTADELQARHGLPDVGNATGGIFLAAHRAGLIRRVGYKPSNKRSRAGSIVAVWTAGEAA